MECMQHRRMGKQPDSLKEVSKNISLTKINLFYLPPSRSLGCWWVSLNRRQLFSWHRSKGAGPGWEKIPAYATTSEIQPVLSPPTIPLPAVPLPWTSRHPCLPPYLLHHDLGGLLACALDPWLFEPAVLQSVIAMCFSQCCPGTFIGRSGDTLP